MRQTNNQFASKTAQNNAFEMQSLETRTMMAGDPLTVAISASVLSIKGTANSDAITVSRSGSVWTISNGSWSVTKTGTVKQVAIKAGAGDDTVTFDSSVNVTTLVYGEAGNDTLTGTVAVDKFYGGLGDDSLSGLAGNDLLYGEAGADNLEGGAGNDISYGGTENDTISDSEGNNQIYGDAGNDTLTAGNGNDRIGGGIGDDSITSGDGINTLTGDAGNDLIDAGIGNDSILGGEGNDTINAGAGNDYLDGGLGNDDLNGGDGIDTADYATRKLALTLSLDDVANDGQTGETDNLHGDIENLNGGTLADMITGSDSNNVINGNAGNDTIVALDGNDSILGVAGNDSIEGGAGNDTINAGIGNDYVLGGEGNDNIAGIDGNDTLNGADGNDTVNGGIGNDSLTGGEGNDTLLGVDGNDILVGDAGNDSLNGGLGNDAFFGGTGNDLILALGGGSLDTVTAGDGADNVWLDSVVTDVFTDSASEDKVTRLAAFQNLKTSVVSKEIAGQNLTDPTIKGGGIAYRNFRGSKVFSDSGPALSDIQQGQLGDCYFLAQLGSFAELSPDTIKNAITDFGDGTYAVKFQRAGKELVYRIDGDLPSYNASTLAYGALGAQSSIWVALMEKAFTFFRKGAGTYASIEAGWMNEVSSAFGKSSTWGNSGSFADTFMQTLKAQLDAGKSVTVGTASSPGSLLVGGHAYVVQSVTDNGDGTWTMVVRNPWKIDGYTCADGSNDGFVTLNQSQALTGFNAWASSAI